MGVSIIAVTPKGKEFDLTPGGRSRFYEILDEERLLGILNRDDLKQVISLLNGHTGDFLDALLCFAYLMTKYEYINVEARF